MFDAVIAGKAKMAQIVDDAKRLPREDLVTLSLFGIQASISDRVWTILRGAEIDETLAKIESHLCLPPQA